MTRSLAQESGFTAIELLITLFIASIFLFAGYQLYTQVTRDGSNAEKTARLSGIVYDKMRQKVDTTNSSTCTASSSASTETVPGIGSVTYTTSVSCPYSGMTVSLVKVSAAYTVDGGAQTLEHATYAYASN